MSLAKPLPLSGAMPAPFLPVGAPVLTAGVVQPSWAACTLRLRHRHCREAPTAASLPIAAGEQGPHQQQERILIPIYCLFTPFPK